MHCRSRSLGSAVAIAVCLVCALACGGGEYSTSTQRSSSSRGDTNGRMFDYVAMTPEGDQWEVRLRGASMWVAYSLEDRSDSFKPVNLSDDESSRVWKLIDAVDLPSRRRGRLDDINGTVLLRLREPGDEEHDLYSVYFSREAENSKVLSLAKYLTSLVKKYHDEKPLL